jgi:hypothetical protein
MFVGAAAIFSFFGTPSEALAAFQLKLEAGSTTLLVTDNDGTDQSGVAGVIKLGDFGAPYTFGSGADQFQLELVTGVSNRPGTPEFSQIEILTFKIKYVGTASSQTIKITLGDTGFTAPGSPIDIQSTLGGQFNLNTNGSIQFESFADKTNAQFGTGFAVDPLFFQTDGNGNTVDPFSGSKIGYGFKHDGLYSMTSVKTLTLNKNGELNMTGGKTTGVVPVPSSVVMSLSALPVLGLLGFVGLRRKQTAAKL